MLSGLAALFWTEALFTVGVRIDSREEDPDEIALGGQPEALEDISGVATDRSGWLSHQFRNLSVLVACHEGRQNTCLRGRKAETVDELPATSIKRTASLEGGSARRLKLAVLEVEGSAVQGDGLPIPVRADLCCCGPRFDTGDVSSVVRKPREYQFAGFSPPRSRCVQSIARDSFWARSAGRTGLQSKSCASAASAIPVAIAGGMPVRTRTAQGSALA